MHPVQHPAETVLISPEALQIANSYLQHQNIQTVASELDCDAQLVTQVLDRREVKAYLDQVFFDVGFNNRHRMRAALDAIIQKKFQELDEADIGSSKDITEILALSHKMTIEHLQLQLQLEKIRTQQFKNQVNVQINNDSTSNYGSLLERIISGDGV